MAEIPLSNGSVALVSDEDVALVNRYRWHRIKRRDGKCFYAIHTSSRDGKPWVLLMHRLILGEPPGWQIDHRNGDGLDNQRGNLRLATASQNQANAELRSDSSSGVRGVSWERQTGKWRARLRCADVDLSLGRFDTIEAAAAAYAEAANRHFGEYAIQNRVPS